MKSVKIKLTGPGRGELFIDGEKVDVVSFNLSAGFGEVNRLTLTMAVDEVEIEAEDVQVEDASEAIDPEMGAAIDRLVEVISSRVVVKVC